MIYCRTWTPGAACVLFEQPRRRYAHHKLLAKPEGEYVAVATVHRLQEAMQTAVFRNARQVPFAEHRTTILQHS